jgi:NAD(P)-dependent dehydrogenase (short-subunit alcohol dehydrogenase family)
MSSPLEDKLFVITGAASGIGRSLAQLLASQGALLSLADINDAALKATKQELQQLNPQRSLESVVTDVGPKGAVRDTILTTTLNVRSQAACTQWILDTVAHFDCPIMGAANLAGVIGPSIAQDKGSIRNITDDEFDFILDVNVKGTLNCLRAQLPHMQQGVNGRGGGSIVNASSIAGIVGVECNGPYVAAKHAVVGLTRTAAKEEGSKGIRVNAVAP